MVPWFAHPLSDPNRSPHQIHGPEVQLLNGDLLSAFPIGKSARKNLGFLTRNVDAASSVNVGYVGIKYLVFRIYMD